jgi:hypothetical protein
MQKKINGFVMDGGKNWDFKGIREEIAAAGLFMNDINIRN